MKLEFFMVILALATLDVKGWPSIVPSISLCVDQRTSRRCDIENLKGVVAKADDISTIQEDISNLKEKIASDNAELKRILLDRLGVLDCTGQPDGLTKIASKDGVVFAQCKDEWLVITNRYDGSVDFNLGLEEYEHGFGDADGEYFLGFNTIGYMLMQGKQKLRIELTTWPDKGSETRYAEYNEFDIAGKHDDFRLTVGDFTGDAGNSLTRSNNMAFSTKDEDRDTLDNLHCASFHKSPGWFSNCMYTNLFGPYLEQPRCISSAKCMYWGEWPEKLDSMGNNYYSFKEMKMMMKPLI